MVIRGEGPFPEYLFQHDNSSAVGPNIDGKAIGLNTTYNIATADRVFEGPGQNPIKIKKGDRVIGIDFLPLEVDRYQADRHFDTLLAGARTLQILKTAHDNGAFDGINIVYGETWEEQMKNFAEKYLGFFTIDAEESTDLFPVSSRSKLKPTRKSQKNLEPSVRYYLAARVEDMMASIDDFMSSERYVKLINRLNREKDSI